MTKKISFEYLAFFFVLSVMSFLYLLGHSDRFLINPSALTKAILADLFLTIPIGYFLIIRKTKIPNFTTIYVLLLTLFLSGFILPSVNQLLLKKIKFLAIPAIEIGIVSTIAFKMWTLRKSFRENGKKGQDFYDNLLSSTQEIFPKRLAGVLTTEMSVFYYLFKPKSKLKIEAEQFSYHKKSGISMVIGVFLFLVVIETFVVHLLLVQWSTTIAWVLTFLSVYAGFQILSILRSMKLRPILINSHTKQLMLRYGHAAQCKISIDNIKDIEKSRKVSNSEGQVLLTPFDMLETPNLIIHLHQENTLQKIYGMKKSFTSIALHLDDVETFTNRIEELMANKFSLDTNHD